MRSVEPVICARCSSYFTTTVFVSLPVIRQLLSKPSPAIILGFLGISSYSVNLSVPSHPQQAYLLVWEAVSGKRA